MIDVRNRNQISQSNRSTVKGIEQSNDSALSRFQNRRSNNTMGNSTRPSIYNTKSQTAVYRPSGPSEKVVQKEHDRQSTDSRVRNEARQKRNHINMGTKAGY